MRNIMKKSLFVFSILFILAVLSFASAQVNVEQVDDISKKVEGSAEKLSDIIEKQKDDKGYLTRELTSVFTKNKIVGGIDSFFKKIDIVFVVLFGEHYALLSGKLLIVFILWVWLFFKIGDLISKGTWFSSIVSHLIALASVVILAQARVFSYMANFVLWAIFAKDAWWFRIIIALVFVIVLGILDYLERMLGRYLDAAKKAKEEAKTQLNQGAIERYAEGLEQGGSE